MHKACVAVSNPSLVGQRVGYNFRRSCADLLAVRGYYTYRYKIIFLAGMALGGSTWMKNLLSKIPGYYSISTPMPEDVRYRQNICDSAFKYVPTYGYTLFKTHLNPSKVNIECLNRNGVEKILVTYRDLRDVIISRYHRLMAVPKKKGAFDYIDYRELPKEQALDHSLELVAEFYVPWINGWLQKVRDEPDRFMAVTFEELKADTEATYRKVLDFYQITLPLDLIKQNIENSKGKGDLQKNMSDAEVLPFGLSSNFRSGRVGQWREELSQLQIERCKELMGAILIELGYEDSLKW